MKIGYFADGLWAHKALDLISSIVDVAFIVPRYDSQDPYLKDWAKKNGVPFIPHQNVNSDDFVSIIDEYDADLFVSMSFNQIIKERLFNLPDKGFINCHAGALPFYRGRNPLNWVLINGESEFGITVHYIDKGIDTGDIIEQKLFPIDQNDTYGTLLERAHVLCGEVLFSAVKSIMDGTAVARPQIEIAPVGSYFGRRVNGDEKVNFSWPAKRFHDFVRGITLPGPCARCQGPEGEIAIVETRIVENAPSYIATEGEVIGKDEQGNLVKVGDSFIRLSKVANIDSSGELSSINCPQFKIGTRLLSVS